MNFPELLAKIQERTTCKEREDYLFEQEEHVLHFLRGYRDSPIKKGAHVTPHVRGLAGAWQVYLSLPADTRPNQTLGIVHASAWIQCRDGNKYAIDYDDIHAGKNPEKLERLEENLAKNIFDAEDMKRVRDFQR